MSGGWTPSVHLFSQSRGKLAFDEELQVFRPGVSVQRERSAGACNAAFGLAEALAEGDAAGRAAAAAAGFAAPEARTFAVDNAPPALGGALGAPLHVLGDRRVKAFVDYQNDVCVKDVELAVQEGMRSIEHVKRYTTTGMATDQGKLSNMNALAIVAAVQEKPIPEVGLTTFRPPYTPVTFGAFAGPARGDLFDPVRRTAIHDWAEEKGAAFEDVGLWKRAWYFPRAGESMHEAVARECRTTRASVGLFDASTLGKIEVVGPDAAVFLERMYANAFRKLEVGRCRYGLMLTEAGFLMDDGVIARLAPDRFHVTTTTGGAPRVLAHMEDYLQTEFTDLKVWLTSTTEHWAVIAIQGPRARDCVAPLVEGVDLASEAFPHMSVRDARVCGVRGAAHAGQLHRRARLRDQCAGRLWPRRLGGCLARGREARRRSLRHRGHARDAGGKRLCDRRPGHRWHGDARRPRPRLGDRKDEEGLRGKALARVAPTSSGTTASSSSAFSPTIPIVVLEEGAQVTESADAARRLARARPRDLVLSQRDARPLDRAGARRRRALADRNEALRADAERRGRGDGYGADLLRQAGSATPCLIPGSRPGSRSTKSRCLPGRNSRFRTRRQPIVSSSAAGRTRAPPARWPSARNCRKNSGRPQSSRSAPRSGSARTNGC